MAWGREDDETARFMAAGVPRKIIGFDRETYPFTYPEPPASLLDSFRRYYGPTMNAFEAAQNDGRAQELGDKLTALFDSQNRSGDKGATCIPATFLRVTVAVG